MGLFWRVLAVGEPQAVRLLMTDEAVGVVSLSASGKAVNVWIAGS
jgi:hypothetical protein